MGEGGGGVVMVIVVGGGLQVRGQGGDYLWWTNIPSRKI